MENTIENNVNTMPRIGDDAPDFKAKTTNHNSIRGLWREGGKSSTIGWTVFIQSSDIFTV